ncbi:MAG: site-specific DNA-methyltransferase [Promethearchaeota archaeon]|nr:MAG: site-specific DNA-methyltransferase [Candidatus Lokiarchaeota archaeon]
MKSLHKIYFKNSKNLKELNDSSIDLVVTSPPYPMIEMWDRIFSQNNSKIRGYLEDGLGFKAFELMHIELDKVWAEIYRVLKNGGIACINIGDATRKIGGSFQLFPNHSRILQNCISLGFSVLPEIIWQKQSNKPNKFMGSGMLPPNAYITQEHEYILILRKGEIRNFTDEEKQIRSKSTYFWEERNIWFSDLWSDIKGIDQEIKDRDTRARSAAFPLDLAYRLINMFSIHGDTILDPFLGTGTTILASMASNRNAVGYEIDKNFKPLIHARLEDILKISNNKILERIKNHLNYIRVREKNGKSVKYFSENYKCKVITKQEVNIQFYFLKSMQKLDKDENTIEVYYHKSYPLKTIIGQINARFNQKIFYEKEEMQAETENKMIQKKLFSDKI